MESKTYLLLIILSTIVNIIFACPNECDCSNDKRSVKCKHKFLTTVPNDIPIQVIFLDLSFNSIKTLPANSFIKLIHLNNLKIEHNDMKFVDENAFEGLVNLRDLNLAHNDLSYLHPETFNKNLIKLLHVHLGNNEFETIPALTVSQMTKLNLDSNKIKSAFINESFLKNTGLQTIVLTKNAIRTIKKKDFVNLENTQLLTIMLKMNNLQNIEPGAFAPLKNTLKNLELEGNKLLNSTVIGRCLEAFTGSSQMLFVDVKNCGITSISNEFFKPFFGSDLHRLHISHNSQLESVGNDAFDGLTELQYLDMSSCKIVSDEIRFSPMTKLRELDLSHNNLTKCPHRFPGSLEKLFLQSNSIRKILKDDFKSLTALKSLNLANNAILSIEPQSFTDLIGLQDLDLGFNRLAVIEMGIFVRMNGLATLNLEKQNPCIKRIEPGSLVLSNLSRLHLFGNCLDLANIGRPIFDQLPKLTNLSLSDNRLVTFNDELFSGCPSLAFVDLSRNQITGWTSRAFTGVVSRLVSLQLAFNQISFVSINPASRNFLPLAFPALREISLEANVWNCTCIGIVRLMRFESLLANPTNILCNYPNDKVGRKLMQVMANCSLDIPVKYLPMTLQAPSSHWYILWMFLAGFSFIAMVLLFLYRRKIHEKYHQLFVKKIKTYNRLYSDNGLLDGYPNEIYNGNGRLTIREDDANTSVNMAFEDNLVNCDDNEQGEEDIVILTGPYNEIEYGETLLTIKTITELDSVESRQTVYKCKCLVINYPPVNLQMLCKLLEKREEPKQNHLLISDDKTESQEIINSIPKIKGHIHRYGGCASEVVKWFMKIVH